MKKKWIAILIVPILLVTVLFIGLNSSPEKKAVGDWELSGTFENFELRYWDNGEYDYFNIHLSKDGIVNSSSYPTYTTGLGTSSGLGTFLSYRRKKRTV